MKILVIDDDPTMIELLELQLAPISSKVFMANSGLKGIERCKEVKPEIIILGYKMPEIDGREVCKKIRAFSTTPILVLSVYDDPQSIAEALASGADDYLIKPVSSNILIACINKLIRRNHSLVNPNTATRAAKICDCC